MSVADPPAPPDWSITIADDGTVPGGVESGSDVGGCEIAPTVGMLGRLRVGAWPPAQPESSTPATSANGTFDVQRYAIVLRLMTRAIVCGIRAEDDQNPFARRAALGQGGPGQPAGMRVKFDT